MNADAKEMAVLPKNAAARIDYLEAAVLELRAAFDTLAAGSDRTILRIPNGHHVDKILMRYFAGGLGSTSYRRSLTGAELDELWDKLPPLPITYRISHDSILPILVETKLPAGKCYRLFYRTVTDRVESPVYSLGFFEVGGAKK